MTRLVSLIVAFGAALLFVRERLRVDPSPPAPPVAASEPRPVISEEEVRKVRRSLEDSDPDVRWTAIQLLFNIRDPQLEPVLDRIIGADPDPELRMKVVGLFRNQEGVSRLGTLVRGISDSDVGVRIASLQALGDVGDPSVTVWVTAALRDSEPAVRIEALRTLSRFQDKRKADFKKLAEKLRTDYQEAVRRAEKPS